MAFAVRNLSVLAYANGFTLWHYNGGSDAAEPSRDKHFFTGAGDMLASGDILMVSATSGGCLLSVVADNDRLATVKLG